MCPDGKISGRSKTGLDVLRGRLWFFSPKENPLYDYLIDLQKKRVHLIDTLAPRRHVAMQLWVAGVLIGLWLLDRNFPNLEGLPMALMILLGPFLLFAAPFVAGMKVQVIAAQNYPSPLDSPNALELLLSTPLTEREIVTATLAALARYPFIGASAFRLMMVLGNVVLGSLVLTSAYLRKTMPVDMLMMSLDFYAPAFAVFLFYPILSAIDQLLVPSDWLRRRDGRAGSASETVWGRSGRLPMLATALAVVPVVVRAYRIDPMAVSTLKWVLFTACPIIIATISFAVVIAAVLLPRHLAALRRG